jgi:cyanobactin cluster PatC/TenC/TruC protein
MPQGAQGSPRKTSRKTVTGKQETSASPTPTVSPGETEGKPRPVETPFELQTGLSDYAMWVELFSGQAGKPTDGVRRGRIWT